VARLIGWNKVSLKPGESRIVTITGEARSLADFDSSAELWRVRAGAYSASIGTSALDIAASTPVTLAARELKP
jgi:beta-glucosidase